MRRFTRLYLDLDATTATSEKIDLLAAYFEDAPAADAAWALALLTGNGPKRAASTRAMRALALERAGIAPWLFDECYAAVGDLSETIALLLPDADGAGVDEPLHRTLRNRVVPLVGADDAARTKTLAAAWEVMNADQRFVYHKLIRGGLRVGVQRRTVVRALARVANVDPATMTQRLVASIAPDPESYRRILVGARDEERALLPMPFYLASPLDSAPEDLGPPSEWLAEWKYDGIRAQVVRRGGAIAVWSRGEELITHQFPELVAAARLWPYDAVVDGEILLWNGDAPLPFAELQTRLNRKKAPEPGLFDTERLVLVAFDLIEHAGADLRASPQTERRDALAALLDAGTDDTVRLSPLVPASDWTTLAETRASSRDRGVEGLMLKHRGEPYGAGRVRAGRGWWKWKIDPFHIDAVLVGAQPGSGRRANLYTDYTFALWNRDAAEDADGRELVTFAKAYSGLTQVEIEALDRWIRTHTTHKSGPFRVVEPAQVFEIAFERAQASPRHKSGVAVRFPRIARWRRDKSAAEADTVDAVKTLAVGQGR